MIRRRDQATWWFVMIRRRDRVAWRFALIWVLVTEIAAGPLAAIATPANGVRRLRPPRGLREEGALIAAQQSEAAARRSGAAAQESEAAARRSEAAQKLQRAREHYARAQFQDAVALLETLVSDPGLSGLERIDALETMALSCINMGERGRGKDAFKRLLEEEPEWRPDPIKVSPPQIEVFDEALLEFQQTRRRPSFLGRIPAWLKVAGGGFLALGAALLISGSGDSPGVPLPEPPDVP
jgi:hypothetical protein